MMMLLIPVFVSAVECDGSLSVVPCNMTQSLTLSGGDIYLQRGGVVDSAITTINNSVVFDGNGSNIYDNITDAGQSFIDVSARYTSVKNFTYENIGVANSTSVVKLYYQPKFVGASNNFGNLQWNDTIMDCRTGRCFYFWDIRNNYNQWHRNNFVGSDRAIFYNTGYGQGDIVINNNNFDGFENTIRTGNYCTNCEFNNNIFNNTGDIALNSGTGSLGMSGEIRNNSFYNSGGWDYWSLVSAIYYTDNYFSKGVNFLGRDGSNGHRLITNNTFDNTVNKYKLGSIFEGNTLIGINVFEFVGDTSIKDTDFAFTGSQKTASYYFSDTALYDFKIYDDNISVQYTSQNMYHDGVVHNLTDDIIMNVDNVWVNNESSFNNPARITFYNVNNLSAVPHKNGVDCYSSCTNTVNDGTDLSFDVVSWSNYSYGESTCNDDNLSTTCVCNSALSLWEDFNCYLNSTLELDGGNLSVNGTINMLNNSAIVGNGAIISLTPGGLAALKPFLLSYNIPSSP